MYGRMSFAQERLEQYLKDDKINLLEFSKKFKLDYQKMVRFRLTGKVNFELQYKLCKILYLEDDFVNYCC